MTKVSCEWVSCKYNDGNTCAKSEIKLAGLMDYDETGEESDILICRDWELPSWCSQ